MEKTETKPERAKKQSFFKRRSFRYGSLSVVFTIIFIAVILGANWLLTVLAAKYPMSLDLTSEQTYKLSDSTLSYLKNLKDDVEIDVIASDASFKSSYPYPYQSLQEYVQHSSHIKLTFVDADKNPQFLSQYSSLSLAAGDVLVKSGNQTRKVSSSDLVVTNTDSTTYQTTVTGNNTEQSIDSAIEYVLSTQHPEIVFTEGHNEQDSSSLQSLLKTKNYSVKTQSIATGAIDSSATMIAIVDPQVDFSTAELQKLDSFLTNNYNFGRNLMVFFDPRQPSLPNLESYLQGWGVSVGNGLVYDQNGYALNIPATQDLDSTVFSGITTSISTALPNSRPLTLLFDTRDNRTTQSIMKSPSTSKLWNPKSISAESTITPSSSDKAGPFTVMALAYKTGTSNQKSNVLVSGSYDFLDSSVLSTTSVNNANDIVTAVNYIAGVKSSFNIAAKSTTTHTISVTLPQITIFFTLLVIVAPLLCLVAALVVFLRRRHL